MKVTHQKAFSLLEVMLALGLGMLLLVAVLQVYVGVKSVYQTIQDNARLQEKIRFAAYFLTEKISMAGYAGCGKIANLEFIPYLTYDFTLQNSIRGYSKATLPVDFNRYNIADNTDVIVIQKADENITTLTGDGISRKGSETIIHVNTHPAINVNDPLLVSDCIHADLFVSNNYQGTTIKTDKEIIYPYAIASTQVGRFTETAYFISSTTSKKEKPRYGLYYVTNYGNKAMVIDGITGMTVKYGIDEENAGKVTAYYTALDVDARKIWNKVLSVIITLSQTTKVGKAQSFDVYIKLRERGL